MCRLTGPRRRNGVHWLAPAHKTGPAQAFGDAAIPREIFMTLSCVSRMRRRSHCMDVSRRQRTGLRDRSVNWLRRVRDRDRLATRNAGGRMSARRSIHGSVWRSDSRSIPSRRRRRLSREPVSPSCHRCRAVDNADAGDSLYLGAIGISERMLPASGCVPTAPRRSLPPGRASLPRASSGFRSRGSRSSALTARRSPRSRRSICRSPSI